MKSIVICSSNKFAKECMLFAKKLRALGVVVYEPHFYSYHHGALDEVNPVQRRFLAMGLTHDHFYKIRKADAVLIFNKGGYIGTSVTLELGYAVALGKSIYAISDKESEVCREILFDAYTPTPAAVAKLLS